MESILSSTSISLLFILVFAIDSVAHLLNLKTAQEPLPPSLRDLQSQTDQQKAFRYLKDRVNLSLLKDAFFLVLFLILFRSGFFNFVQTLAMQASASPLIQAFIFVGVLGLGQAILGLPFSIYSTFHIESKYGFNRTDARTFVQDLFKGTILTLILGGLIFSFILKMLGTFGENAWIAMWLGYTAFQFFIVWIAPVTLLPLFLKLSPLPEGNLKASIEAYSQKQNFKLDGAWVCDASKRSSKSNAFFTGFGRFRRLVLFDTLIAKHTPEEIVAIVAHEAGHFKLGHIWKSSLVSALSSLAFFFVVQKLIGTESLYQAFQVSNANPGIGLVLATLVFSKLLFFISPIRSYISRKNEFAADHFSLTTNGDAASLVSGLKRLVTDNLATLQHHPLYVILYDSHPPLPDRIKPLLQASLMLLALGSASNIAKPTEAIAQDLVITRTLPAQIIIFRHGEKPKTGSDLNERGRQRAAGIPGWLLNDAHLMRFGAPVAVYAADQRGANSSRRMIETAEPLAAALKLQVLHPYNRNQNEEMLPEIESHPEYAGKTIVICWQSENIPVLAEALGLTSGPSEWPSGVFDRAWVLEYTGNRVTQFQNLPEHILPGDSAL